MRQAGRPSVDTPDVRALWDSFSERLHAHIRARVASDADAQDLLQEVFVAIGSREAALPQVDNVQAWLATITRNAITDYYRARAKHGRVAEQLSASAEVGGDRRVQELGDDVEGELSACLRPFVPRLPAPYAQALTLTDLGGMSQVEAAQQLGLSVSAMKSRVQRGRAKLKAIVLRCCDVQLDREDRIVDFRRRRSSGSNCDC